MNWSALIFGSSTNFIIPLVLYISSKIYSASTADTTGKYNVVSIFPSVLEAWHLALERRVISLSQNLRDILYFLLSVESTLRTTS